MIYVGCAHVASFLNYKEMTEAQILQDFLLMRINCQKSLKDPFTSIPKDLYYSSLHILPCSGWIS